MSKFLTPPVCYNQNGSLNDMLTGEASLYGIAIGNSAASTTDGVAVGYSSSANNAGVAIGSNADASSGGIAIGQDAHAASSNTIQLGDSALTFELKVGNGQGILKIGSIAFQKMRIYNNKVGIGSPGVYLCCTTVGPILTATSDVAICFINDINKLASMLTSSAGSCSYDHNTQFIIPGTNFTMKYCFKIISL